MKTYLLILSSVLIISCSRSAGMGNVIYDNATIIQLSKKNDLKEQKMHEKAVKQKRSEIASYQTSLPDKKTKKH